MYKCALITGITGQDGSYLAEFLLQKGYVVHGIIRRSSSENTARLTEIISQNRILNRKNLYLHYGDLSDSYSILNIIKNTKPDEIYNLAAQSHVAVSFEVAEYTSDINAIGALRILESIRSLGFDKKIKFYQASTSELFGDVQEVPQNEKTKFYPRSPYAVSKLFAYWITVNHREAYNMFACNGILFNHESPRRSENFVTRKITINLVKIALGLEKCLKIGNLDALRDWGHAKDYVHMQWLMLQQDKAEDFVIATGEQYSVRQFVIQAAKRLGISLLFEGSGDSEFATVVHISGNRAHAVKVGDQIVEVDKQFYRPAEVHSLKGDASKAKNILGWIPKISFIELVNEMVDHDYEYLNI